MRSIPESVRPEKLTDIPFVTSGKVSELYRLQQIGKQRLLLRMFSDRVSVHEIVLPFLIPGKGVALNVIDHFWRARLLGIPHDVVVVGFAIDEYLPEHLRGSPDLWRRARIVIECQPVLAELIYRGYLTGTAFKSYLKNGIVCGQQLRPGLIEWDKIVPYLFSPTTKNKSDGHDDPMTISGFVAKHGRRIMVFAGPVFGRMQSIAAERGLILVDMKIEVGINSSGRIMLIDEAGTPDAARYLVPADFETARSTGARPPSLDKQPIRDYVSEHLGVDADTPLTADVVARVQEHIYPLWLTDETARRYEELCRRLTGMTPMEYLDALKSASL